MPSTLLAFKSKYSDILVFFKHLSPAAGLSSKPHLGGAGRPLRSREPLPRGWAAVCMLSGFEIFSPPQNLSLGQKYHFSLQISHLR